MYKYHICEKIIMSDSSEDEDLSKFKSVVDTTFLNFIKKPDKTVDKRKSDRYLEISSHYNDVKVPKEMQKRIGSQVSALIDKHIEFIDIPIKDISETKVKGGVKLFKDSSEFLSCEEEKDILTELHNQRSKTVKFKRRRVVDDEILDEHEKINASSISGEYVLSREETKLWKSRRKEKLYKYKSIKNSNSFIAIE